MNLNIVLDTSQFKPFDYSLALNAIKEYNTGYEKQQAVYDKIAQTLGDLASAVEGTDKAKKIYDAYQEQFNTAADSFSNGMNFKNAKQLADLRRLYGTQIRQLEKANEAMVKEAERRRAVGPEKNMLYQDIGNLDKWMEDPARILGSYSGTQLSSEVAAMAKAVGDSMVGLANSGRLDPYNKTWLKTKGFKPENINKAIAEVQQGGIQNVKDDILRGILTQAMDASGINTWADEGTKRAAENLAARGLYGGIGQSEIGHYEDKAASKALDYYYAIKQAQDLSDIKVNEAKKIAAASGLGTTGGGLGETVPLHFSDQNVAGDLMKRKLAEATAEVIKRKAKGENPYYAQKIIDEWKDKEGLKAAVDYWAKNGFDGSAEITGKGSADKDGFYYTLKEYIRRNITPDERIIDIWTSPYQKASQTPIFTYGEDARYGINRNFYNKQQKQRETGKAYKDWKNFNERATQGYTFNGILGADDMTTLREYLGKIFPLLQANGEIGLYDIESIDQNGNIKYGDLKTKLEDFPTKKDGEGNISLDLSRISSRITLPDGSWLLTWNDKDGNPVQRVLKASDRSTEYQGDLYNLYQSAENLINNVYKDDPAMQDYIRQEYLKGRENIGYDSQRQVKIEPQKLQ